MFERISLKMGQVFLALKREEGQGATEYAMVIGFLVVGLAVGLGVLGVGDRRLPRARRRQARRPDGPVGRSAWTVQRALAAIGLRSARDDCAEIALGRRPLRVAGAPGAFSRRRSELPPAGAVAE